MNFLHLLEGLRTPFLDTVMTLLTHLGEETLFMMVALVFFWCLDKHRGYYLLFVGFTGTVCIQILKMIFRVPRPWVLDPEFTIVESAREGATGYSFPSGHTQCATNVYGGIARSSKRRWVQIGGVILFLIVALTRMYLGVHTPLDVGVSLLLGIGLVFLSINFGQTQWPSLLALPLLYAYNGKRGKLKLKYFFYIFYPTHLVILEGIVMLMRYLR
jgi:undecaprenyl-diphosphatase